MSKPIELACGKLRLIFEHRGDRYAHRIVVQTADGERGWLSSAESLDESPWPTSPPLQQIHVESRDRGVVVALAVGMAWRSHWSAAFELDPTNEQITCDVACRVNTVPAWLGSSYELTSLAGWSVAALDDARLFTEGERITILPAVLPTQAPETVRWRYRFGRCSR
ncbi:MAG: hypothetical protein JNM18_11040 [Planctomycetaceae bacterium]|nr:hypothetical protein [Planctomycetaceae bacterium]